MSFAMPPIIRRSLLALTLLQLLILSLPSTVGAKSQSLQASKISPTHSAEKTVSSQQSAASATGQVASEGSTAASTSSAEKIRAGWGYQLQVIARGIYLCLLFLPVIMSSSVAYFSSVFRNTFWFALLARTVANSGAAFIKWGQWASTRPDMFPVELCDALAELQAGAPTHRYATSKIAIEHEMDGHISSIFSEFGKKPLASGSIAQVHKAQWKGLTVAVKVRHPGVEQQIMMDFDIMGALASCIESIPGMDWLNLSESLTQFSSTIASQVRLDVEGHHLDLFNEYFKDWKTVQFPVALVKTDSVLVESFMPGRPASEFIDKVKEGLPVEHKDEISQFIVVTGEDLYLKMLLQDNLMHADLHPGNILVDTSGATASLGAIDKSDARTPFVISLVDAGMVAELTYDEQENFIGLLEALGEGDGREAADYVINFSSTGPLLPKEVKDAFREDMHLLFQQKCKGYGTNVDIGVVLRGVLEMVRKHRVTIEANYATLVMNALVLDSMSSVLVPAYNVLDAARPLLRFHRRCRRLPGSIGQALKKKFMPMMLGIKRKRDKAFFAKLKREAVENGKHFAALPESKARYLK